MQCLRAKVAEFSRELQDFAQQLATGVDELKRTAKAKPCVGPSAFREGLDDLVQQAAAVGSEVSELEHVTLDAVSLEELLGHCLAQLQDNKTRVSSLEDHLRQYGYTSEFVPPEKQAAAAAELPCISAKAVEESESPAPRYAHLWEDEDKGLKRAHSSPEHLDDEMVTKYGGQPRGQMRVSTVTPSPVLSSTVSMSSISPSLRDLQLKYGPGSGLSTAQPEGAIPRSQLHKATTSRTAAKESSSSPQDHSLPDAIGKQLDYLAIDTPQQSRLKNHSKPAIAPLETVIAPQGWATEQPARAQNLTVRTGVSDAALVRHPSVAGSVSFHEPGGVPPGGFRSTPMGKDDIIMARLAAGEAPWDMLSLKAAISHAAPGTGKVEAAIHLATFHPQAAAFTSLLHMCAKQKLWEKALEVFRAMKAFHPSVTPNTVHFSSLISACATAGRWKEAMEVFEEMKAFSSKDKQCAPNVITYSALMTACCAGGRPDKAHEVFLDMQSSGIKPDHICYSTLIAGYERFGAMDKAKAVFEDMKAAGLSAKAHGSSKIPNYLEQFGRKIARQGPYTEDLEAVLQSARKIGGPSEPSHHNWNSFGSSGTVTESPMIGAHYGRPGLSRGSSTDFGAPLDDETLALRQDVLRMRSPSQAAFVEALQSSSMAAGAPGFSAPQHTPISHMGGRRHPTTPSTAQLLQAARGGMPSGQGYHPSPLARSFDSTHAPTPAHYMYNVPDAGSMPPPGFAAPQYDNFQGQPLESQAGHFNQQQQMSGVGDLGIGFQAEHLSRHLAPQHGLADMTAANKLLEGLAQQQMSHGHSYSLSSGFSGSQPLSPMPPRSQEAPAFRQEAPPILPPPPSATKAQNGAPQMPQVLVEEYNNLPLRFSRQLSLDQMNEAVDYINNLVEGKQHVGKSADNTGTVLDGVTPQELSALQFGPQRTTALLNCLLSLKRMHLTVREGQQAYIISML